MNTIKSIVNTSPEKLAEQFRRKLGKTIIHHKGMLKDFCVKNCPHIEKTKKGFVCPMFLCPTEMKRKYNAYLIWGKKKLKETETKKHYQKLRDISLRRLTVLKFEKKALIQRSEKMIVREMRIRYNFEKKRVNIVRGYCKTEILRTKAYIERLERINEALTKRIETFAVPEEIATIALQSVHKEVTELDRETYKTQKTIEFAKNAISQTDKYKIELGDLPKKLLRLYDERGRGWTHQKLTKYMKELERGIDNNLEYPRNDADYPKGRRRRPRLNKQNTQCDTQSTG